MGSKPNVSKEGVQMLETQCFLQVWWCLKSDDIIHMKPKLTSHMYKRPWVFAQPKTFLAIKTKLEKKVFKLTPVFSAELDDARCFESDDFIHMKATITSIAAITAFQTKRHFLETKPNCKRRFSNVRAQCFLLGLMMLQEWHGHLRQPRSHNNLKTLETLLGFKTKLQKKVFKC